MQETPRLYLSTFTTGRSSRVYQVQNRSMAAMAENTDLQVALEVYRRQRESFSYWHEGERINPIPEDPPVWDGDAGKFIKLEEIPNDG